MDNFSYYPIFSKITKSVPAGIVLSYIVGLTREINPIKITNKDLAKGLYFTISTIIRAKKKLKKLPFVDINLIPNYDEYGRIIGNITQYEIDFSKMIAYIKGFENE